MSIEPVPEEPVKTPQHDNEVVQPEDETQIPMLHIRLHGFPDKPIEYLKEYLTGLIRKMMRFL